MMIRKYLLTALSFLFFLGGFILLSGCSAKPTAYIDFSKDTNFSQFSSFTLVKHNSSKSSNDNPVLRIKVEDAVQQQLALNNLTPVNTNADLQVTVSLQQSEKANDSSFSIGLGTGSIGRSHSSSISLGTSIPIENTEHYQHIIIDISHNGAAIWHGRDQYLMNNDDSNEQEQLRIKQTVQGLLANFPPSKSQNKP